MEHLILQPQRIQLPGQHREERNRIQQLHILRLGRQAKARQEPQ